MDAVADARWGLVGLGGAALGASPPAPGPLALALACALGGGRFNRVMDLYTWTLVGEHTLDRLRLVVAGRRSPST